MLISYRRLRRTYLRPILFFLALVFFIDAALLVSHRPDTHRISRKDGARSIAATPGKSTVYIASVHRNTADILRGAWNTAVLDLVHYFGAANVHVTAIESGSQDETKEALIELKLALDERGVSNTIELGQTVWEQLEEIETRPSPDAREPGWIWNVAESQFEMRRIPYLARVRNQAMRPLKELEGMGRTFDKVLWINDVVFDVRMPLDPHIPTTINTGADPEEQTEDIITLMNTHNGNYAAACSMDYKDAPLYYDTFALRDDMGQKSASLHWPWFQSPTSRASALRNDPVQVESCWNGIVAFNSAPYYTNPPLEFRGIDDSLADLHLEGSECCLIHADNFLTPEKGVWLNPNVRVGYSVDAYHHVRTNRFPNAFWTVVGAWANRIQNRRMSIQSQLETREVQKRLEQWKVETPNGDLPRFEPGEACLINEMQIMWSNGWKHL